MPWYKISKWSPDSWAIALAGGGYIGLITTIVTVYTVDSLTLSIATIVAYVGTLTYAVTKFWKKIK